MTDALLSVVSRIRRQIRLISAAALLATLLGIAFLVTEPPRFTATATILIDYRRALLFQQQQHQAVALDSTAESGLIESQVEMLKSDHLAERVVEDLRLSDNPTFMHPKTGAVGQLTGGLLSLVDFGGASETSDADGEHVAVELLQRGLRIKRVGLSSVIEIAFSWTDPALAAQIANAVADTYIAEQLDAAHRATERATAWLQEGTDEMRSRASRAQQALADYKKNNDIVSADGKLIDDQRLSELNSQLVAAQSQTSEAKARLDRIESVIRTDATDPAVDATVTDTLKNDVISKLRSQYLELANRAADLSSHYGYNHLAAVRLRDQMRDIRNSIRTELSSIAEGFRSDYEIARQRESAIRSDLDAVVSRSHSTNQVRVPMQDLETNAQASRALYDSFLQRYMDSVQQQSFPIADARPVSRAARPMRRSYPQPLLVLLMSSFAGGILGLGIATLRDAMDRAFRTRGQVEAALQTDCIALVPRLTIVPRGSRRAVRAAKSPHAPRTIVNDSGILWTATNAPLSRFAEAIRSIELAVDLTGLRKTNTVLGFASSVPNEGKSTIAASLAQLMARAGRRTILLDCDLRNPSLSSMLAPQAKYGVLEVIADAVPLDQAIWAETTTNLNFLPVAASSQPAHSKEILASEPMKVLFDTLRGRYERVIVDLPPLAPVVDARATAHLIDSYVLVVEWGRTPADVVEHAISMAPAIYENLLGVVLNKADIGQVTRYIGQGGSYYSDRYFARHGQLNFAGRKISKLPKIFGRSRA